jgi:hypothetical protein
MTKTTLSNDKKVLVMKFPMNDCDLALVTAFHDNLVAAFEGTNVAIVSIPNTFDIEMLTVEKEEVPAFYAEEVEENAVYYSDKFSAALELINNQISKIHDEQNKHDVHSDEYKSSLEDESAMLKIKLATTELFTDQKKSK